MTQPQPDLDQLKAHVQDATEVNNAALADLAKHHSVQIEAHSLTGIRLAALVEHILGDMDSPQRLLHELRIQELFAAQIATIRSQLARATLLHGVNGATMPTGLNP
jgi:hypothetical protein